MLFAVAVAAGMASCNEDDSSNYNSVLNDFKNEKGSNTSIVLKFDTIAAGTSASPFGFSQNIENGTEIYMPMKVEYAYPERLKFTWIVVPYRNGQAQTKLVGNKQVYVNADTIATTKDLRYTVDLEPNNYQIFCIAEDTTNGLCTSYACSPSYQGFAVPKAGIKGGLYLLTETADGNTDLEIFTSGLMLIYGGQSQTLKYYSTLTGNVLPGKPRWIHGGVDGTSNSKNAYVVATDKGLFRLNKAGLVTMDDWNTMFYETPAKFDPQQFIFLNNCEFLINDGKLYTLYSDKANSRKYSAPISGDYVAAPYLMYQTKTSWGHTADAFDADQVIFDKKNKRFIPYYNKRVEMSQFSSTAAGAYLDANKVAVEPAYFMNAGDGQTYCIVKDGAQTSLLRFNFYNTVDDGDLSADGERSTLDLSGCTDINNATMFASTAGGSSFYYSAGKNVYSFSPQTGQTDAKTVYTCEGDEEVTCIYAWGSIGGGWPTSNLVLFIATWSESKKESKLIQYEMDHTNGIPNSMFGPMFGAPENPVITTGWQKIKGMVSTDAE